MPRRVDVPDLRLLAHEGLHETFALLVTENHDLDPAFLEVLLPAHEADVLPDHYPRDFVPDEALLVMIMSKWMWVKEGEIWGQEGERYGGKEGIGNLQYTSTRAHVARAQRRVHGRAGVGARGQTPRGFQGGDLGLVR